MQIRTIFVTLSSLILIAGIGFLLFFRLNKYPSTLYNWENYPVWNTFQIQLGESNTTFRSYFLPSDGLMTDSGLSPLIGLPMNIIIAIFGHGLGSLRLWTALLTLLGLICFFMFTKQVFGRKIATLATIMFGSSQAFLLYGRTATNVGATLLPEMITVAVIYFCLKTPGSIRLATSAFIVLVLNYYFYAPIRFFTPILLICISKVVIMFFSNTAHQVFNKKIGVNTLKNFLIFLSFCLLILSLFIGKTNILEYYNGRGEHLLDSLQTQTISAKLIGETATKIGQNAWDFIRLVFSIDSRPVVIDFGNHYGQMINRAYVPFFVIGVLYSLKKMHTSSHSKYRLLVVWFLLTSLPILFTSNVHIGRLFLSLAPMYILTAVGVVKLAQSVVRRLGNTNKTHQKILRTIIVIFSLIFYMSITATEIRAYFFTQPTIDHNIKVIRENQNTLASKKIYLVNAEESTLHFWEIVYYLKSQVFFTDGTSFLSLDRSRKSTQVTDGWLFSNNAEYTKLTTFCLRSDAVLITVGKPPASSSPSVVSVCRTPVIRLFE